MGVAIVATTGAIYVADTGNNRLDDWTPSGPTQEPTQPAPNPGTSAVATIDYNVPLSGAEAPNAMGTKEVEAWAQTDVPVQATTVFPPDKPMGWPAKEYKRATVYYLDGHDRTVNIANANGGISTTEYNATNDVVRTLSADSREAALKAGSESATDAKLWDTERTYNSEGTELQSVLGPQHTVGLPNGTQADGRAMTRYYYDEGAPATGGPYQVITKTTTAALVAGKEEDLRTTATAYSGQNNLGWELRKPTSSTVDPTGLKPTHSVKYDPKTGNVTESRLPAAGAPGEEVGYSYGFKFGKFGSEAGQMKEPQAIAIDSSGDLYIVDTANNRINVYNSEGTYLRKLGGVEGQPCHLNAPEGIAIERSGKVWVADTGQNNIVQFSPEGECLAEFGNSEEFNKPAAVAVAASGIVWVADTGNSRIEEVGLGGSGYYVMSRFGSLGTGATQFKEPQGITLGAEGNLYISDSGNSRIEEWTTAGTHKATIGSVGESLGQLKTPHGIGTDAQGNVWIADTGNKRTEEFTAAGTPVQIVAGEKAEHRPEKPQDVAVDLERNVWIVDSGPTKVTQWMPNGSGYEKAEAPLVLRARATSGSAGSRAPSLRRAAPLLPDAICRNRAKRPTSPGCQRTQLPASTYGPCRSARTKQPSLGTMCYVTRAARLALSARTRPAGKVGLFS